MTSTNKTNRSLVNKVSFSVAVITLVAFLPTLRNGFIEYDDPLYVTENPHVQAGLTAANIHWAWTSLHAGFYQPLTWMSFQLDAKLFGERPWGYHLTNCLLHAVNAVLVFLMLQWFTGSIWRSAAVAVLFAVHPLRVESVAWVTERKDLLSTFFGLLTIIAYGAYCRRPRLTRYILVLLFLTASVIAKPMLVTMPFVLLLLDFWPLERWPSRNIKAQEIVVEPTAPPPAPLAWLVIEKLPFLAIAVTIGLVTVYANERYLVSLNHLPLSYRLGNSLVAYGWYLQKTFWPNDLALIYPHPSSGIAWWELTLAGVFLAAVSAFVLANRSRPYLLVGWLWFLGTLIPVIGLTQIGDQRWADRFTYFPHLGLLIMLVWGLHGFLTRKGVSRSTQTCAAAALIVTCVVTTWVQVGRWHDNATLLNHTLRVTEQNAPAHLGMGISLAKAGQIDCSIHHLRESIRINPDSARAHFFLGESLASEGAWQEATTSFEEAVRLDPNMHESHFRLGCSLDQEGRAAEAMSHFEHAVQLQPDWALAHYQLALALVENGRFKEADEQIAEALRLEPELVELQFPFAMSLVAHGRPHEAVPHFQAAIENNPHISPIHYHLALALASMRNWSAAAAEFRIAVVLEPYAPFPNAGYAWALHNLGQETTDYQQAFQLDPQWLQTATSQAWTMATSPKARDRNGIWARALAEQAAFMTQKPNPHVLDVLATAYAECGQFPEAIVAARQAIVIAHELKENDLEKEIKARLGYYQRKAAFRSTSPPER